MKRKQTATRKIKNKKTSYVKGNGVVKKALRALGSCKLPVFYFQVTLR